MTGLVLHCCQRCVASRRIQCHSADSGAFLSLNYSLCPHCVAFFFTNPETFKNDLAPIIARRLGSCFVSSGFGTSEKKWQIGGPVAIAVVLFVVLTPGLFFQLPGNSRAVEFANMQTSGVSILVHTINFGLITIYLIAIGGVHISTG